MMLRFDNSKSTGSAARSLCMRMSRALLVAIMMAAPAAWLWAQDEPAPAAAPDSGVASDEVDAAEPPPANADEVDIDDWEMPSLPPGLDDDTFIPSEEISADEEVIFPVDI